MCRGIRETPYEFIDGPDALNRSQGTPYLTRSTISYVTVCVSGNGGTLRVPSVIELLNTHSVLIDLKIFFGEHRAERTKPLLGDGLEWVKGYNSARPRSNQVDTGSDRCSCGSDEQPLHLVL